MYLPVIPAGLLHRVVDAKVLVMVVVVPFIAVVTGAILAVGIMLEIVKIRIMSALYSGPVPHLLLAVTVVV